MKARRLFGPLLLIIILFPLNAGAQEAPFLDKKMNSEDGAHFLWRTGFGPSPGELKKLTRHTYRQAIEKTLNNLSSRPHISPPKWLKILPEKVREFRAKVLSLPKSQRKKLVTRFYQKVHQLQWELKAWWIKEICTSPSPLTERLTLLWHNHFTSSMRKCKNPLLLYRQNQLFRKGGQKSFKNLLYGVIVDPAMLIYLDSQTNRKGHPNENFARELLELFTLGEGKYTERDIREAARAFTGFRADPIDGKFQIKSEDRDRGVKVFLGERGRWIGDDIIDILFAKKAKTISLFIVKKFWREFISPRPHLREVHRLARIFRRQNFKIRPLLKALFSSVHFWKEKNRGRLIKSPVELVAGLIRGMNFPVEEPKKLARLCAYLGQNLFDPPNVKGWEGGKKWITSATLLYRHQVSEKVLELLALKAAQKNPSLARKFKMYGQQWILSYHFHNHFDLGYFENKKSKQQKMVTILLAVDPAYSIPPHAGPLETLSHCLRDPAYQLR